MRRNAVRELILTNLVFKLFAQDGGALQIRCGNGIDFLVGCVDPLDVVSDPCVAVCKVIGKRLCVGIVDDVLGVQHVQHFQMCQGLHHVLRTLGTPELVQLSAEVLRDDILVTTQLGTRVATKRLMEVAGAGIVEHVFGDVGYPVAQGIVGQNGLVGHRSGKWVVVLLLVDKLVVVEVALVDGEHVDQHQHGEDGEGDLSLQLALAIEENRHGCKEDEQQAAQGILAEDGDAHILELRCKLGVNSTVFACAQRRKLLGFFLAEEAEKQLRSGKEQQADARRDAQGDEEVFLVFLEAVGVFRYFGQAEKS